MTTKSTVTAITNNIEAILSAMALSLEDQSGELISTKPLGGLEYLGDEYDDNYQERPFYNTAGFRITITAQGGEPSVERATSVMWVHDLKNTLTVESLNVGDLSVSKLVARVSHNENTVEKVGVLLKIEYEIGVKYRGDL